MYGPRSIPGGLVVMMGSASMASTNKLGQCEHLQLAGIPDLNTVPGRGSSLGRGIPSERANLRVGVQSQLAGNNSVLLQLTLETRTSAPGCVAYICTMDSPWGVSIVYGWCVQRWVMAERGGYGYDSIWTWVAQIKPLRTVFPMLNIYCKACSFGTSLCVGGLTWQ